uniref:D-isomer specific 2-hydroxyacid dehydrogenase catalytic domain-containing protein n=1 Tax=Setaria italica TaxID=4555 RepID=K4ALA3_SETIT
MESLCVQCCCCTPWTRTLEQELGRRCRLLRFCWDSPQDRRDEFLRTHGPSVRALVSGGGSGCDAALIDALPRLEIIACYSVGFDPVDLAWCRDRGVRVTNSPGVLTDDVADLAVGLAIAALRRIPQADRYIRAGHWKANVDYGLTTRFSGKRVGIWARQDRVPRGWKLPVARSTTTTREEKYKPSRTTPVQLAANSDVLVVACSLNEQSRRTVSREVIERRARERRARRARRRARARRHARRGPPRRRRGAGLDVFEDEPDVPEVLTALDHVVLAPHVGSGTRETRRVMADLVLGNLEAHALEKPLLTPVV